MMKLDTMRLMKARMDACMSCADLARACNVHRSTVGRWERGLSTPRPDKFKIIARVTGRKPEYFMREG